MKLLSIKGYNEKEHHAQIQEKRDFIEKYLILILKSKLITDFEEFKKLIENLDIKDI